VVISPLLKMYSSTLRCIVTAKPDCRLIGALK